MGGSKFSGGSFLRAMIYGLRANLFIPTAAEEPFVVYRLKGLDLYYTTTRLLQLYHCTHSVQYTYIYIHSLLMQNTCINTRVLFTIYNNIVAAPAPAAWPFIIIIIIILYIYSIYISCSGYVHRSSFVPDDEWGRITAEMSAKSIFRQPHPLIRIYIDEARAPNDHDACCV